MIQSSIKGKLRRNSQTLLNRIGKISLIASHNTIQNAFLQFKLIEEDAQQALRIHSSYSKNVLIQVQQTQFNLMYADAINILQLHIYQTLDGQIIVAHPDYDHKMRRYSMDPEKYIFEYTFKQLQGINIGNDLSIPLLSDVFKLCKGKIFISIEIKPQGESLPLKLLKLIDQMDMWDGVAIISFELQVLQFIRKEMKINPIYKARESDVNFVYCFEKIPNLQVVIQYKPTAIALDYHLKKLTDEYIDQVHKLGIGVTVWPWVEKYGEDQEDYRSLLKRDFDQICCNNPILLREYMDSQ